MNDALWHALLTPAQMGRADQAAIAGGVPGVQLMRAAGQAVAEAIRARWDARAVLVVCGPGNNGGDGFVVARLLAEWGWPVRVVLLGSVAALRGDAAVHAQRWRGDVFSLSSGQGEGHVSGAGDGSAGCAGSAEEDILLAGTGLVIDAVFGAGLSRDFDGPAARLLQAAQHRGVPICAVDVPSGLDGATGTVRGFAAPAQLTVTFFRKKPGHLLLPGRELCGEVVLADIGIPDAVLPPIEPDTFENAPGLWSASFPWPVSSAHKYRRGHVLIGGGACMTGAARLAALAAARAGAGLVTVASPPEAWAVYAAALTSIMVERLPDSDLAPALADERRNVVVIGPGAGRGAQTRANVLAAAATGRALVLDADALTVFAEAPQVLFEALHGPCIITPHEGEFVRLFGGEQGGKLERARGAARRSGAVVILKGADTVIAEPGGRAVINANAPAWLATGGTGDVLAGLTAGLLAQGMPPFEAACAAVWMHGEAGTLGGPGLISEDLPGLLPRVLQKLLAA